MLARIRQEEEEAKKHKPTPRAHRSDPNAKMVPESELIGKLNAV